MVITLIPFLIIIVIGYIAQRIGICMIKGVGKALDGDPALLLAIFVSGCWLWVYFLLSDYLDWENNLPRYAFHPVFMLGGFVFGVGAGINQACSVSTMNRLTKGDLSMLMTMFGWAIGWCLWMGTSIRFNWYVGLYQVTEHLPSNVMILLFLPALGLTVQRILFKPAQRKLWLGYK